MEMQDIETTEDSDNWKKQVVVVVVVVVVTSSLIDDQAPKNKYYVYAETVTTG